MPRPEAFRPPAAISSYDNGQITDKFQNRSFLTKSNRLTFGLVKRLFMVEVFLQNFSKNPITIMFLGIR